MATATRQVEQIVRKVMSEEMDETVNAIQEISTLLTEQVIPRLGGESDEDTEMDDEEATEGENGSGKRSMSLSTFGSRARSKPGRGRPNGHADEDEDVDQPEREVPEAVTTAFEELYRTLSPEQARAFADLFSTIDGELEDQGEDQGEDLDEGSEAVGRG